ncbi:MAG: tRNA (N6-threonylcarbamoyladenosine(37)-N6)-methyltransferase TrmO [Desulfobacteraceae bacterium]
MNTTEKYRLTPIGTVHHDDSGISIEIQEAFEEALLGLEDFSHLVLLYWMNGKDNPKDRAIRRVHPMANPANPLRGVFATRSPARPNPIGLDVARILSIEGRRIRVDKTDALDGTPLLDIKPFIPRSDARAEAAVPAWVSRNTGKEDA